MLVDSVRWFSTALLRPVGIQSFGRACGDYWVFAEEGREQRDAEGTLSVRCGRGDGCHMSRFKKERRLLDRCYRWAQDLDSSPPSTSPNGYTSSSRWSI